MRWEGGGWRLEVRGGKGEEKDFGGFGCEDGGGDGLGGVLG